MILPTRGAHQIIGDSTVIVIEHRSDLMNLGDQLPELIGGEGLGAGVVGTVRRVGGGRGL